MHVGNRPPGGGKIALKRKRESEGKKPGIENGFMTVEAAFVFPFVICVIMAVIWLSFYMFGKVSVKCDTDRLILKGERIYRDYGKLNNSQFYGEARETLNGYPLSSCIVSRCYGDYGDVVIEYVFNADTFGSIVPEELSEILGSDPCVRQGKADKRIDYARYLAVGKSIFTKIKGYATGWRNGNGD